MHNKAVLHGSVEPQIPLWFTGSLELKVYSERIAEFGVKDDQHVYRGVEFSILSSLSFILTCGFGVPQK